MIEGLWSKEVIDRVRTLFGDDSVEYGMALSQNPDLVERLGNLVTGVRVLTSDLDKLRDMLAPPPHQEVINANRLLATINLALEVEAWLPELRDRIEQVQNPNLHALESAARIRKPHRAGRRTKVTRPGEQHLLGMWSDQ